MSIGGAQSPPDARGRLWTALGGVRGRLLALVAAATIPIAVIAGNNAWSAYQDILSQGPRNAVILREVAVARHGAAVDALKDQLTGLATHGGLMDMPPEDCDAVLAQQRHLKPARYSNFWVLDANGDLVCSGLATARGVNYASLDYFAKVFATRAFTMGEFTTGVVSHRPVLPAAAPILWPDGSVRALVGGSLYLDFFLRTERSAPIIGTHHAWLLDEDGTMLPLGDADASALPPRTMLATLASQPDGAAYGLASNGLPHAWAAEELEPGLQILVSLPVEQTRRAAHAAFRNRIAELAAFFLACLAAIVIGVEAGVVRPLRRLAERVQVWVPGRPYAPQARGNAPLEVRELDRALTGAAATLQDREDSLKAALKQRDLLMAEIHHRVKNNLQIVASLLSLQGDRLRSATVRAEFAVARDRVQALATLHRHLYQHQSFERISLRPFLEELCRQLGAALGTGVESGVSIEIEAEDIEMGSDQAISLALLLTEAVSNAMRHAFPSERKGTISICLSVQDEVATLRVADDGIGCDEASRDNGGLGMQLIEGFARHLGGVADMECEHGTSITVRFPLQRRERDGTLRNAA